MCVCVCVCVCVYDAGGVQEDGSYFIDRSPSHFDLVMEFLRGTGCQDWSQLPATTKESVISFLDYLQIDGGESFLPKMLAPTQARRNNLSFLLMNE